MDAERWERINEVFALAIDVAPNDRSSVLRRACRDDRQLWDDVEAMLGVDQQASQIGFLTPLRRDLGSSRCHSRVGERLGRYRIQQQIGQGGMGTVYLASRTEDYEQSVAIKLLKRGMDTDEILRRFRTEIQVLASLSQHPNIAGILDAGTTDDGLPYFVMEYVAGERIDRFCDQRQLTIRQRLELFQDVCSAVQFAHQHAVIHRDLKPSNILVTTDGTVKLIDFGIARFVSLQSPRQDLTATGHRCLTPGYASPEQMRGESITTASDVYSLGAVLYELLCGRRVHAATHDWHSLLHAVCNSEPEKPSVAIEQAGDTSASGDDREPRTPEQIGNDHGCVVRQLRRSLAGDVDNIVLRALHKEPSRRFASVEQLSADVARHLEGQPVLARPIGRCERVWRWCRCNPMAASLFFALVTGSVFGLLCLSQLSQRLVRLTALDGVEQQTEIIQAAHNHYSGLVEEFKAVEPSAAEKLTPPATFTIELGNLVSQGESGFQFRMYSDKPFRTRKDGGPKDAFDWEALRRLRENSNEPVYSFEDYMGRPSLRYAVARVMDAKCVKCHNSHPDRPAGVHWQVGDVRGVLEVIRPVDTEVTRTRDGLKSAFGLIAVIFAVLMGTSAVILVIGNRRRKQKMTS